MENTFSEVILFPPLILVRKPTLAEINDPNNTDATVTFVDTDGNSFPTGKADGETSHCYTYFSSSDRTSFVFSDYSVSMDSLQITPASSSTESDKLSGIGLQFGYRGEKWRASFTHYTGQGGDNELTNSLVIADYFFQEKFFVGAGLASIKLTNSSAGSSIPAPRLPAPCCRSAIQKISPQTSSFQ